MRAARFVAILWVVFLSLGVSQARAGVITAFTDPAGPGCNASDPVTGPDCSLNKTTADLPSDNPNTVVLNNDNTPPFVASSNDIRLDEVFNRIDYLEVEFTVLDSLATGNGVTEYFTSTIVVNNFTGQRWTDFHWELTGSPGDGLDFDNESGQPLPTAAPPDFLNFTQGEKNLDWYNGAGVADGGSISFTFSIDVPDGISSFKLRSIPTVAASEPSALLLLGSGLAGLGLWRRWHS
jgi:hypothetical protein